MTVHLFTSSTGFPNGTAAANRIKMIGMAIQESGCNFKVYTNSVEHNNLNISSKGSYEKIAFTYLHGNIDLDVSKFKKLFYYLIGICNLFLILKSLNRKKDVVYVYAQGEVFNLFSLVFCKIFGLKIIQEINEWHSEFRYLHEKFIRDTIMVRHSDGGIIISNEINNNVRAVNNNLKTIIIPVLQSPDIFFNQFKPIKPYCFWMGLIDGYLNDVLFIIESCGLVYSKNSIDLDIILSGPYSQSSMEKIYEVAKEVGFPLENIKLVGYLAEDKLNDLCGNAFFYIIPFWNNQRSQSRFPTKLATFMFFGKPIITAKVGEVGELLSDNENVLFYNCEDKEDLASKIVKLFVDKLLYEKLCENSIVFANSHLNYKIYSIKLKEFFTSFLD